MRVALAADHAGYKLKNILVAEVKKQGCEALDLGTHCQEPSDYPDFAEAVAKALLEARADRGILVCGSAVGVSVAANKFCGIRAGVCHDTYSARQGVEHDDVNVLCLGERVIGVELARELVKAFLSARFQGQERFARRLKKIEAIESRTMKKE